MDNSQASVPIKIGCVRAEFHCMDPLTIGHVKETYGEFIYNGEATNIIFLYVEWFHTHMIQPNEPPKPIIRSSKGPLRIERWDSIIEIDSTNRTGRLFIKKPESSAGSGQKSSVPAMISIFLRLSFSVLGLQFGMLLIHSAAVKYGNRTFVFMGASGSGKSTLCELFPFERILGDETAAVVIQNGFSEAWPTPFGRRFESLRNNGERISAFGKLSKGFTDDISDLIKSEEKIRALLVNIHCVGDFPAIKRQVLEHTFRISKQNHDFYSITAKDVSSLQRQLNVMFENDASPCAS